MLHQFLMKVEKICEVNSQQRAWTIDWHPSGKFLASSGSSKNITIWKYSLNSLQKVSTIETDHSKTIRCVKFSHDGQKIAAASFDFKISVWIYNGQSESYQELSVLDGHQSEVKCVSWSKDDKKIASCSRDKNVWIWEFDPISYDYVCDSVLQGHTQDVKFVDWILGEQNKLISCSYDNTLKVWEGDDDDYTCTQTLEGHASTVWAFAQHKNSIFSVSEDYTIIHWCFDKQTGFYHKSNVIGNVHALPIYCCCILKDKYLVTGSGDNSIAIMGIEGIISSEGSGGIGKGEQGQKNRGKVWHESDVNCVKQGKDGQIFASCSDDEKIAIWKVVE